MKPVRLLLLGVLTAANTAYGQDPNRQLDELAEAYFEETLQLNTTTATSIGDDRYNHLYIASFAQSTVDQNRALAEKYSARLAEFPRDGLDAEHRITYDLLAHTYADALQSLRFPNHLQPLNQFYNFTASFAQMGAGTGLHPFKTVKDYDDFLSRMRGFEQAVDTAIANMRRGVAQGIVQPRVLMERVVPQLSAHIVANVDSSIFYRPVVNMPASFAAADRARLTAAYQDAIRTGLVPAITRLRDFVRDEYLPASRTTFGLGALPNGQAWYASRVRTLTTADLTPAQIHDIGLAEVARIHKEMERVKDDVGFRGTLPEFFRYLASPRFQFTSREEMLEEYRAAQARIDPLTDKLFSVKPKATYEIRAVEPFRERSASGGSYMAASPDGTRPGVFYLNTYNPTERSRTGVEALLLHEGSPGHHFQLTIQRELEHVPRVRRFGGFTAYTEGWGLYAESLGRELGVYTDPYQYYGALAGELWRAIRLVLDTGIHEKGWTREQAMAYARENSSQSETSTESEVERFAAIPGQALAYKIGQLKITELRKRAETQLGPRFDLKAFHRVVLESGALPLGVLEAKVDRWIAAGGA
jgi:uncharacterized protein (DUF885 family)